MKTKDEVITAGMVMFVFIVLVGIAILVEAN